MPERVRRWLPVVFLILAIVVPYHRLVTMQSIIVTDDRILSDVFHGEFPARLEMARIIRGGELPLWTPRLCTGYPLGAGLFADPLTLLTFVPLPPVAALNVFLLATLIIAALGAYALARRFGASPIGATLTGLSFSWSGYLVCQLKHLGIMSVVCWLPVGLLLLDRALAIDDDVPLVGRLRALCPFALVAGLQWASNFPQSAYICSAAYGAFAFAWVVVHARRASLGTAAVLLSGAVVALMIAVGSAAGALLPMRELSTMSDRTAGVPWDFATMLPYSPRDWMTFFVPYVHGDVSNLTYVGSGLFWENYGYVGLATMLLAFVGAATGLRHVRVLYLIGAVILAYLIVLGPATPVFKVVFHVLPGMKSFRFPTRWLVVVDLGIAVLGGLGLTYVEQRLKQRGAAIACAIVGLTTVDLVFHQMRQNPLADPSAWLKAPATAEFLHAQPGPFRIYTPLHFESHTLAWKQARGWSDLAPYFAHRETLQPNSNLFWGLDTCDCYAGLSPASSSRLWGDIGVVNQVIRRHGRDVVIDPRVMKLLALNNVGYLLSRWNVVAEAAQPVFRTGEVSVWAIPRLPRTFVVSHAVPVTDLGSAVATTVSGAFDPTKAVVIEGPSVMPEPASIEGRAAIVSERTTELEIATESSGPAWLVLADQFYPGWTATLDGQHELPIVRANGRHRAVRVPAGAHRVKYTFTSDAFAFGLTISAFALVSLLGVYLVLRRLELRARSS